MAAQPFYDCAAVVFIGAMSYRTIATIAITPQNNKLTDRVFRIGIKSETIFGVF